MGRSDRHPGARIQVRKAPTKPNAPGTVNSPQPIGSRRAAAGRLGRQTQRFRAFLSNAPKGENAGPALQRSLGQTRPGHDR